MKIERRTMFWLIGALAAIVLAHTAPFPFLLDVTDETVWRMPADDPPTIYLTFDDGPNSEATPGLLDVLRRHEVKATFFVIDKYITDETVPILERTFDEGHAVALHSHTRRLMFSDWRAVATTLQEAAARIEVLTGRQVCRAFRPHAGHRSVTMLMGAARAGYVVVGWGWMLWDFNGFHSRTAEALVPRLISHASAGDIVVIHDGHHQDPRADRQYAIETVDQLIPQLKERGFQFGTICLQSGF
jgi:peptidoglycan/xylan/chitin deacetylase (PgdA/CDA1 family)